MKKFAHEEVEIRVVDSKGEVRTPKVDAEIAPLIQKLNDKGFPTRFCCSGHIEDEYHGMYIMFGKLSEEKMRKIKELTGPIDEFFVYTVFRIEDLSNGNGVRLVDPTEDQINLAKILLKMNNQDPIISVTEKPILRYGKYRTAYSKDPDVIEQNHREVLDIFRRFEEALDNMEG